jgi:sugar lactone lactonase YvrE
MQPTRPSLIRLLRGNPGSWRSVRFATVQNLAMAQAAWGLPFMGCSGIAFLNGELYYNSNFSGKIYRVPLDTNGKAGVPVEISLDQPLSGPDGMRPGNNKLFVAEQRANRIVPLAFSGDSARVVVIREGPQRPTGVQPDADTLWYAELTPGRVTSMPIPR